MDYIVDNRGFFLLPFFSFSLSLSLLSPNFAHARHTALPRTFSIYFAFRSHLFSLSLLFSRYVSLSLSFANCTCKFTHIRNHAHTFAQDSHNKHAHTEISLSFSFTFPLFLFVVDVAPFFSAFEHFYGEVGVRLCHFLSFR